MLLANLTNLLPPSWRPYAKAVYPALLALVAVVVRGITTGQLETPELEIAVVGLLSAGVSLLVTNLSDGIREYAKAVVPAFLTGCAVVVHYLVTGSWDQAEWTLALTGFGAALTTLLVPNSLEQLIAVPRAVGPLD